MSVTPGDTRATKAALRRQMLAVRRSAGAEQLRDASRRIAGEVTVLPEFADAQVVMGYLNLPEEVSTREILDAAWLAGKQVAVPAAREDGEYVPVWLTPDSPLATRRFGVSEPAVPVLAKPDRFDLILVPGVAFTVAGGRLGHGKGYYDRMLARLRLHVGCRAGICMESQIVPAMPVTESDVTMDMVVTERAVYRSAVMRGGIRRG